jgi:hypothetical protein
MRALEWPVYSFDRNGYRSLGWHSQEEAHHLVTDKPAGEPNRYIGEPRYIKTEVLPELKRTGTGGWL